MDATEGLEVHTSAVNALIEFSFAQWSSWTCYRTKRPFVLLCAAYAFCVDDMAMIRMGN